MDFPSPSRIHCGGTLKQATITFFQNPFQTIQSLPIIWSHVIYATEKALLNNLQINQA
jgi:hypothetical protein